jgi:hypothetical protein
MVRRMLIAVLAVGLMAATPAAARPPDSIRVGGPSAPGESKVAIIGTHRDLAGHGFEVIDSSEDLVHGQGFHPGGQLETSFAMYEDVRRDYVTDEPALDYAATSELLLASLRADCSP